MRVGIEHGWCGMEDDEAALREIAGAHDACTQVRASAVRWLAWPDRKHPAADVDGLVWLLADADGDGGREGKTRGTFAALVRLDRALVAGDVDGAAAALAEMMKADPGLIGNLHSGASVLQQDPGAHIAVDYPD